MVTGQGRVLAVVAAGLALLACGSVATPPNTPVPRPATSTATLAPVAASPVVATPATSGSGLAVSPTPMSTATTAALPHDSGPVTVVGQFDGAPYPFEQPALLAVDRQGAVYAIARAAHRIQKYDRSGAFIRAWGKRGAGAGEFDFLAVGNRGLGGLAVDADGNVYVADNNNRVQKFDRDGALLTSWGSFGTEVGQFRVPAGIAVDSQGQVYVADLGNYRVQKFDCDGSFLATWGNRGRERGQFFQPWSIAVNQQGQVYVADLSGRIQVFDSAGRFVNSWGGVGDREGEFLGAVSLAIDERGIVYAGDNNNHRVQVFDADGNYLAHWGSWGHAPGQFDFVGGIALDSQGLIHVASVADGRIQTFRQRQPWPATPRGTPTPRPTTPTPPPAGRAPVFVTPTDR